MPEVRLIDANSLIGFLHNQIFIDGDDRSLVYGWIEEQPTIEPEVRHGRWKPFARDCIGYTDEFVCSKCECSVFLHTFAKECEFEYCPNCGARMDGGADNG